MLSNILALDDVPPAVQEHLFEVFVSTKRHLDDLARYPGLTSSLDERLGQISTAAVRAAWLNRPDRDPDVRDAYLLGEKRVGVLAAAVQQACSTRVWDHVEALPPGDRLDLALVESPFTPARLRVAAAARLARPDAPYRIQGALRSSLPTSPEIWDALARVSDDFDVLVLTAQGKLSDPAKRHLSKQAEEHIGRRRTLRSSLDTFEFLQVLNDLALAINRLRTQPGNEATIKTLTGYFDQVRDVITRFGKSEVNAAGAPETWSAWYESMFAGAQQIFDDPESRPLDELVGGMTDESAAAIADELYSEFYNSPYYWAYIKRLILQQEQLDLRVMAQAASKNADVSPHGLSDKGRAAWILARGPRKRLCRLAFESPAVRDLVRTNADLLSKSERLALFPDPSSSCFVPPAELITWPVDELATRVVRSDSLPKSSSLLPEQVGQALLDGLRDLPQASWVMFDQMAPTFPGSLEALLGVVAAAHAE